MGAHDDSDAEISKLFDDRIRLHRRRALGDITNATVDVEARQQRKEGNLFVKALHESGVCYSYGGNGKMPDGATNDGNDPGVGARVTVEKIESPVRDGVAKPRGAHRRDDGGPRVVFKDLVGDRSRSAEVAEESKEEGGRESGERQGRLLSEIQNELEELRMAHKKALSTRGKLVRMMEREMGELRRSLEAEKKEEIESLKRHYDKMLLEKKQEYRESCRQKILEYKGILDEAYRTKAAEYRDRCNEMINKMKKQQKRRGGTRSLAGIPGSGQT